MARTDDSMLTELHRPTRLGMRFMFGPVWLRVPGSGALMGLSMQVYLSVYLHWCMCVCVCVCMHGDVMDTVGRTVLV